MNSCVCVQVTHELLRICRYLTGLDAKEFAWLFEGIAADLQIRFPRTAMTAGPDHTDSRHMTLDTILFLTFMRARHGTSVRALEAMTGFSDTYISRVCGACEQVLAAFLEKGGYGARPSLFDIRAHADGFRRNHPLQGVIVRYNLEYIPCIWYGDIHVTQ